MFTMSDVSSVVVGVVSVLSAVAAVTWLARPSEFRSVRVVSRERSFPDGPLGLRPTSDARRTDAGNPVPDSPQAIVRRPDERPRTDRPSYYETARLSVTNRRVQSRPPLGIDEPRYFLRYSALGQELGPFSAAEKARLVASANSTVTLLWRQDDDFAAPSAGKA